MGTQGVPFNIPKNVISDTIKKRNGVLRHVAKDLNCHHGTLLRHINADPELKELLEEERNAYRESMCDAAEGVLQYALSRVQEDPGVALAAARFVLNNLGKKRGYSLKPEVVPESDPVDDLIRAIQEIKAESRGETSDRPAVNDNTESLND